MTVRENVPAADDILAVVRSKGVRVWSEHGQLRYRALKGALTPDEIDRLRISKDKILALLQEPLKPNPSVSTLEHRSHRRAPLSFSQLQHWNLYRLGERSAIRQIADVIHLRGRLDVEALRKCLAEVVRRHDALRTRIPLWEGVPVQEIAASNDIDLEVRDLSAAPESSRQHEVMKRVELFIAQPIDVSVGPLFGALLLKLDATEHVLIVAMEHMISDMFSSNIFFKDLFTTYAHFVRGRPIMLPPIPVQFADYAVWQHNSHPTWLDAHGAYWRDRLRGCERVRFPGARCHLAADEPTPGWGAIPFEIGKELTAELREWSRVRRTTLVMSVFTAYVALVFRWCGVSDAIIQYQTDGRTSPKIENTLGYFASVLYLRVSLGEDDNFIHLLSRVIEKYCEAYEHADASFMESQTTRPEFTRNSVFNWLPRRSTIVLPELEGTDHALSCTPVPLGNTIINNLHRDNEPMFQLCDCDDEIAGGVYFPLDRFSADAMERLAGDFILVIETLLKKPGGRVRDLMLSGVHEPSIHSCEVLS